MLTKSRLKKQLDKFPESFTIDELVDRLIILEKIENGEKQSANKLSISEEDMDKEIEKWFR